MLPTQTSFGVQVFEIDCSVTRWNEQCQDTDMAKSIMRLLGCGGMHLLIEAMLTWRSRAYKVLQIRMIRVDNVLLLYPRVSFFIDNE